MREQITIDETIEFLNNLLITDQEALTKLVNMRVRCTLALANHPTVQVRLITGFYYVGLLGILNGLFGIDEETGWGDIVAVTDTATGQILRFKRLSDDQIQGILRNVQS